MVFFTNFVLLRCRAILFWLRNRLPCLRAAEAREARQGQKRGAQNRAMEFNFMYLFASAAEAWTSVPLVS
jgi:hypothetical protein